MEMRHNRQAHVPALLIHSKSMQHPLLNASLWQVHSFYVDSIHLHGPQSPAFQGVACFESPTFHGDRCPEPGPADRYRRSSTDLDCPAAYIDGIGVRQSMASEKGEQKLKAIVVGELKRVDVSVQR
jgi:hypothetical protein